MPTGARYVRDERQRLANLIAAADLWTERDNATGAATAASDGEARAYEELAAGRMEELPGVNVHRRFQVRFLRVELRGLRATMSPCQDVDVLFQVLLGRFRHGPAGYEGGADAYAEEAIAQDAERIRQLLWHPENRERGFSGTSAPIYTIATTGRRALVTPGPVAALLDEPNGRLIWTFEVRSWLRVDRETFLAA